MTFINHTAKRMISEMGFKKSIEWIQEILLDSYGMLQGERMFWNAVNKEIDKLSKLEKTK